VSNGETNVRAGSEFTVKTEDKSVNIRVRELEAGSWVMFKLPGFAKAAAGDEQNSLDALRSASKTSWFKANDALWVKLVSTGYKRGSNPGAIDSLQVSR
jgi:cell migration-inducing and hyaluronan-binding protein